MSKDIEALIERLEKATGGDTRLDRAILEWEGWNPNGEFMKQKRWIDPSGRVTAFNSDLEPIHFYTSSVDAGLALCERMLPRWSIRMSFGEGYRHPNVGMGRSYPTNKSVAFDHHTMPLAILLALFTALNQEESRSEESKNG